LQDFVWIVVGTAPEIIKKTPAVNLFTIILFYLGRAASEEEIVMMEVL